MELSTKASKAEKEKKKMNNTEKELQPKPVYYGQKGRALVWYWRAVSAYEMAARIEPDGVTVDGYEAAAKLLDSCRRYALADARKWEADNTSERYANSEQSKKDGERLDARRERLQKRLAAYGLQMVNFGLYPTICDKGETYTRSNINLNFFN